jgi:hypothetical protein
MLRIALAAPHRSDDPLGHKLAQRPLALDVNEATALS